MSYLSSSFLYIYFHIFFFNDTATTEIYTLSLHDALPICRGTRLQALHRARRSCDRRVHGCAPGNVRREHAAATSPGRVPRGDRKSTRLNSSHGYISYAVFCLKKKKKTNIK